MSIQLISILVLLGIFIVGSIFPISLGVFGFVAAFVVGNLISGLPMKDIFAVFPADLFVTIAGVSYLFAIVQKNGTIDLITRSGLKLVNGNRGVMPWIFFSLTAFVTIIGSSPPATVAIFAPIALQLAAQYGINPLLMGTLVVNGSFAGYYSPLNPLGLIVSNLMAKAHIPFSPVTLFINSLIYCVLVSMVIFIVLGGLKALKSRVEIGEIAVTNDTAEGGLTPYRACTILGIVLLIVSALVFKFHIGFSGFVIGLALNLMAPKKTEGLAKLMPWSVLLLLTGIVTYIGVLDKIGTVKYTADLLNQIDNPILTSLIASYVAGILSSFASTTGMLAVIIPLVTPILNNPIISTMGVISAITIAAAIVDLSPFSTNGALILANVKGVDENKFFKQLLIISGFLIILGPGLAWLMFVLIGG